MTITELEPAPVPITEEWLRGVGFKWTEMERQGRKHWLLWLGACINLDAEGRRQSFSDSEDLGIELSAGWFVNKVGGTGGSIGQWHCWLRSDCAGRYHRFLHIRHLHYTHELVQMIEGLTGQVWDPANNMYGVMLFPKHAQLRRDEAERLDRRLLQERKKWYPAEDDDTRAGALPEHLNAAIEAGKAK